MPQIKFFLHKIPTCTTSIGHSFNWSMQVVCVTFHLNRIFDDLISYIIVLYFQKTFGSAPEELIFVIKNCLRREKLLIESCKCKVWIINWLYTLGPLLPVMTLTNFCILYFFGSLPWLLLVMTATKFCVWQRRCAHTEFYKETQTLI